MCQLFRQGTEDGLHFFLPKEGLRAIDSAIITSMVGLLLVYHYHSLEEVKVPGADRPVLEILASCNEEIVAEMADASKFQFTLGSYVFHHLFICDRINSIEPRTNVG